MTRSAEPPNLAARPRDATAPAPAPSPTTPDPADFFGDTQPIVPLPVRILFTTFVLYTPYLWLLLPGPRGFDERHFRWLKTWAILPGFVFRNGNRISSPEARLAMGMATIAILALLLIPRRRESFAPLMVLAFTASATNAYFCFLIYWR